MRAFLLTILLLPCFANHFLAIEKAELETWNWLPSWRDQADCGPNALYVLMNLEGHKVKLEDVKKLVPLDPVKGCSMEALIGAAAKLGFALEARFVKPGDVYKLPRPFIVHGITSQEKDLGHFIVVTDFDPQKRNFALIDPIRETHGWNPEASVLYNFSGYVLVPKYPVAWRWNLIAGLSLIFCSIGCLLLLYRRCHSVAVTRLNSGTPLFIVILSLLVVFTGCNRTSTEEPPARRAARGETIPLVIKAREFPLQVAPLPGLENCVTDEQILVALKASLPLWHPPSVPSLVHELKLWGKDAVFTKEQVGGEGRGGKMMVETLLSDPLCREHTVRLGAGDGGPYMSDSPYGIHPIQSGSYDAIEYRAETHFGKLTMLMGLANIPLSTPVTTSSGRVGAIADILQDTIMNFGWEQELEFVGCSLAYWLPPERSWTNKFGETFTFDELMERLLDEPLGKGCCAGTHVLYTVMTLLRVDEQVPILEPKIRAKAETWFKRVVTVLEKTQQEDGTWRRDWGETGQKGYLYGDSVLDNITIIGHHLEWMGLAPERFRVSQQTIQKSVVTLVEQIEQQPPLEHRAFKSILPCSHAGVALCQFRQKQATEYVPLIFPKDSSPDSDR